MIATMAGTNRIVPSVSRIVYPSHRPLLAAITSSWAAALDFNVGETSSAASHRSGAAIRAAASGRRVRSDGDMVPPVGDEVALTVGVREPPSLPSQGRSFSSLRRRVD